MIEKQIKIKFNDGLDTRPAALFVQVASKFNSEVYVHMKDKKVNAKSIMGMMSLGVIDGESIIVTTSGEDEGQAMKEILNFLGE